MTGSISDWYFRASYQGNKTSWTPVVNEGHPTQQANSVD